MTYQEQRIVSVANCLLFGLFFAAGFIIPSNIARFIPLILLLLIVFQYQLDKVLALFLSLILLTQLFSMLPKTYLQFYGVYSMSDIGFAALFLGYLLNRKKAKFPFHHYKILYFFYLVLIVEFIYTLSATGQGIMLTLRSMRYFSYFLLIFVAFDIFQTRNDLKRFAKMFLPFFVLSCLLFIYQGVTGKKILQATMMFVQNIGGYSVYRSYAVPPLFNLLLIIFLGLLLTRKTKSWIAILIITLCIIVAMLSYTRGIYFTILLGIALILVFQCWRLKNILYRTRALLILMITFFGSLVLVGNLFVGSYENFSQIVAFRFQSGIKDLNIEHGNFAWRWWIVMDRIKLILKYNPILGMGWVNNESNIKFASIGRYFFTVDSGWGSMIGSGGFLFVFMYVWFLLTNAFRYLKYAINTKNLFYRIIHYSTTVYIIMLIISTYGGTSLIDPTIAFLALMIGISEKLHFNELQGSEMFQRRI